MSRAAGGSAHPVVLISGRSAQSVPDHPLSPVFRLPAAGSLPSLSIRSNLCPSDLHKMVRSGTFLIIDRSIRLFKFLLIEKRLKGRNGRAETNANKV